MGSARRSGRRRRCGLVAGAAAVLVLAACGHDVVSGRVTGKGHQDGYTSVIPMIIGNPPVTTVQVYDVPECWYLALFDGEDGYECVTQQQWESVQIGDTFGKPMEER